MKIYAIDHIQLSIPPASEDLARAFYADALGFVEITKPPELAKRGGVWFEQGEVRLHLGVEENFRPLKKAHPALLVDDLNEIVEKVRRAGFEVDTSQPPLEGYRRAHIFDPFGNRLEMMEKIA